MARPKVDRVRKSMSLRKTAVDKLALLQELRNGCSENYLIESLIVEEYRRKTASGEVLGSVGLESPCQDAEVV